MKNSKNKYAALIGLLLLVGCDDNTNKNKIMQEHNTLFPQGDKLPNAYFTGEAHLYPLLHKADTADYALGSVTFEPGARTNWHTHPKGQVLIVTEGVGWYQERNKQKQRIAKGDVVNIPKDVEHWHGASQSSKMVHIAITNILNGENATWLEPVSDADYRSPEGK